MVHLLEEKCSAFEPNGTVYAQLFSYLYGVCVI